MNRYKSINEARDEIARGIKTIEGLLKGLRERDFEIEGIAPSLIKAFDIVLEGSAYLHSEKYASPQGTVPRPSYTDYDNDFLPFPIPEKIKRDSKYFGKARKSKIVDNIDIYLYIDLFKRLIEWMLEDAGEYFEEIRNKLNRMLADFNNILR